MIQDCLLEAALARGDLTDGEWAANRSKASIALDLRDTADGTVLLGLQNERE